MDLNFEFSPDSSGFSCNTAVNASEAYSRSAVQVIWSVVTVASGTYHYVNRNQL